MCAARTTNEKNTAIDAVASTAGSAADGKKTIAVPKVAYSVKEACEATSLKMTALYDLLAKGKIRARKIGRRTVILADDLKSYLEGLPTAGFTPMNGESPVTLSEMDRLATEFDRLANAEREARARYNADDTAEADWKAAWSQCEAIVEAIADAEATTYRHLQIRARAFAWYRQDHPIRDDAFATDPLLDEVLAARTLRDLLAVP